MDVEHRLICRKGFGYVLVARYINPGKDIFVGDFFVHKTPEWAEMSHKIALAEELFSCKCEYENFSPAPKATDAVLKEAAEKVKPYSSFDHPFFRKAPAMAALKDIAEPKPEHVRACLMELTRHVLTKLDRLSPTDL